MTDAEFNRGMQRLVAEVTQMNKRLARITDAIEAVAAPEQDVPASGAEACSHQERVEFGVTGGVLDWQCCACGYRSVVTA